MRNNGIQAVAKWLGCEDRGIPSERALLKRMGSNGHYAFRRSGVWLASDKPPFSRTMERIAAGVNMPVVALWILIYGVRVDDLQAVIEVMKEQGIREDKLKHVIENVYGGDK